MKRPIPIPAPDFRLDRKGRVAGWVFALAISLPVALSGAQSGDFSYHLYQPGKVTILGYTGPGGRVEVPDRINGLPVTALLYNAFASRPDLTDVTLPEGLEYIGVHAFYQCTGLVTITLPASVRDISNGAFEGCTGLQEIIVSSDSPYFSSLNGVWFDKPQHTLLMYPAGRPGASYTVPLSVTNLADRSFSALQYLASVTIPDNVVAIGSEAFRYSWITDVSIGNGVKVIGESAFNQCLELTGVTLGDGEIEIGRYAFLGCRKLAAIDLPDQLTRIGARLFEGCISLTNLTIPGLVSAIDLSAFNGCTNLTAIEVSNSNTTYSSHDGLLLSKDQTQLHFVPPGKAGTLALPDSLVSIGLALVNCPLITTVLIPESVASIAPRAFVNCATLNAIEVAPGNLSYVSDHGVLFDQNQTTLICYPRGKTQNIFVVPESVTRIGSRAFTDDCII